jgi:signal transduction histidine kinase
MPHHKDISLPLKVHNHVLGAMDVRLPSSREIDENTVRLLCSAADQIGVAIENARLFEETVKQSERLRQLSGRLAEAEVAERQRLARELHDQVGECLAGLGISLSLIRKQVRPRAGEPLAQSLNDSMALVEETTRRIRGVVSELRPPMLDDYGLVATLRWYGQEFFRRSGIHVHMTGDDLVPRPIWSIENALFRIAVEALTNVAKHSGAHRVEISVEGDDEKTVLVVRDDGVGFEAREPFPDDGSRGWGLLTMSERAEAVGGKLAISSNPDSGGTRICVTVPR